MKTFGLNKDAAIEAVKRLAIAIDGWKEFFRSHGVADRDLDLMAQYIDGSSLKAQRAEFIGKKSLGLSS